MCENRWGDVVREEKAGGESVCVVKGRATCPNKFKMNLLLSTNNSVDANVRRAQQPQRVNTQQLASPN